MESARFSTFAYATIIHIWQWKKPITVILICGSKSMFYGWRSAMLIIPSDSLFSKYDMKKNLKTSMVTSLYSITLHSLIDIQSYIEHRLF